MKKKLTVLSLLVICAAIVASGTLAYFTAEGQAHNVITSGGVGIELVETTQKDDGTQVEFPEEGLKGIMPGTSASKIVSVKNTGAAEAWIRVFVNTAIVEAADLTQTNTPVCLPLTITADGETIDVVSFEVEEDDWLYNEDDCYYYYREPVSPGKSTNVLFDQVKFAKQMGNEYQNCKVLIDITAEAVQTANNPIPDGGDVTDVLGWPES